MAFVVFDAHVFLVGKKTDDVGNGNQSELVFVAYADMLPWGFQLCIAGDGAQER